MVARNLYDALIILGLSVQVLRRDEQEGRRRSNIQSINQQQMNDLTTNDDRNTDDDESENTRTRNDNDNCLWKG